MSNIVDNLSRVRLYYMRADLPRALNFLITGMHACVKANMKVPPATKTLLRDAVNTLGQDKELVVYLGKEISYSSGNEKAQLLIFETARNSMLGIKSVETKDEMRARKMRIDKAYNLGLKYLAANKVSEADHAFGEAINDYKDETQLYVLIGKALCNAGQYVRAMPYVKKAFELLPNSDDVKELVLLIKNNRK